MKRISLILLLLLTVSSNIGFTQTNSRQPSHKNAIQIEAGLLHTRLADQGFTHNRLHFRGTHPKIGLGYQRMGTSSLFSFHLRGSIGDLSTKQKDLPADFITASVDIEYLKKLKTFTQKEKERTLFGGLQFQSMNYIMLNEEVFDNIGILSLHGLYLKLAYGFSLPGNQRLQLSYSLPAMVYTNRVLWNGGASIYDLVDLDNIPKLLTTHGKFYYFNIPGNVQLNLLYTKPIGKQVDLTGRYAFRYIRNGIEAPARLYSNELLVGLKINF